MIRHFIEVFLLTLAAFALGTAGGIAVRMWWNRRPTGEPEALALPVAAPLSVAPSPPRAPSPARPKGELAAPASSATTPASPPGRALIPVGQRPRPVAKQPGTAIARIGNVSPGGIDGRRLFQEHLKAAAERREQRATEPTAPAQPGTALARPATPNGHLREIDLTAIRRQPQRTLPSRPISKRPGPSLPILLPALRPDDAWNDEPKPPAPRSRTELRDIGNADDPWAVDASRPVDLPAAPRRQTPARTPADGSRITAAAPRNAIASGGERFGGARKMPSPKGLPAIAAPRSDQIWIEAARADAGLPPSGGGPPAVRATYRTDGKRPSGFDISPAVRDNLRRIRGVGQGFEKRLNELGVYKFSQIAAWNEAEQQWISDQLGFPGRVERDDWPSQATRLLQRRQPETALTVNAEIVRDP